MFVCPECGAAQAVAGTCPADNQPLHDRGEEVLLGTTVGAYRVARLLGIGGMGRVYKGVHPEIGSRVAIKVLSRECADRKDLIDRFFSEARAVNLIRHESIVNVLDLSRFADGRPYIVMEYLDGAPLAEIVARAGGTLPLGGLTRLVAEVLDALGAAHAKGIVHRDLKPDNIYITPTGRSKVLDFGIAKLLPELGGSYTQTGSLLGTPHYMAPEQALGKPIDHRTDIYAMGVILYECVTGRRPFNADSLFDLLRKHVDEQPIPPRQIRHDLSPAFEHVILTAMAKDPAQRFPSTQAMSAALIGAAQQLPPAAWAAITPAAAGMTPGTPSGAQWGSGPTWNNDPAQAPRAWIPSPSPMMPAPAPSPSPIGHMPTTAQGYSAPQAQPQPQHAPTPQQRTPSTATAGQVLQQRSSSGSSKGLWFAIGALILAGGGIAIAVVATGGKKTPDVVAAGSGSGVDGSGSAAVPAGSGSSDVVEPVIPEADDTDTDTPDTDDSDVADPDDVADTDVDKVIPDKKKPDKKKPTPPIPTMPDLAGSGVDMKAIEAQMEVAAKQIEEMEIPEDHQARKMMHEAMKNALAQMDAYKDVPHMQRYIKAYKKLLARFDAAERAATTPAEAPDTPGKVPDANDPITMKALPPPPGFNPKRLDVTKYTKQAIAHARQVDPDAKLFRIDADYVSPDGTANLTIGDHASVDYRFISPARAKRPADLPMGVDHKWNCMFRIMVTKDGVERMPMSGWECKETIVPVPKCSASEVWKTAISKGAPDKNALASLGYRSGGRGGKPVWYFGIKDVFSEYWPDDC
jgi:serine/threonine protein kinase